jgi:hypothetical protein
MPTRFVAASSKLGRRALKKGIVASESDLETVVLLEETTFVVIPNPKPYPVDVEPTWGVRLRTLVLVLSHSALSLVGILLGAWLW